MSSNNNSESSTSESEISSCSSNFNPRKALYSQKTKIPVADAPMYENVQQYEAALSNKEIIAVGHSDLVKKREEEKERRKKELEQELEEKNKQRFAKYKDLMPTKKEKISRNVLTRMETVRGPLSALKNCVDQRLRIKIGDDFSISDLLRFPLDDNPLSSKAFSSSTPAASSSLTIPLPNSPVTINLPEDSTSLEICDLPLLLNSTLEGKGLLNLDKSIPLNNAARLSLVRIIGTCILRHNPEQIVRSSVYANWARAITSLFLQEKSSVYFHTKIVESTRGIITRLAGKLPDQIHNLKRKYRDSGIVEKRRRTSRSRSSPQSPSLRLPDGLTDEKDAEEKLLWLRNSSEPWTAVEEKWEETTETRLTASKELTIAQYFDEYTALKKPKGYLLLQKDFEHLYTGQYIEITETFPTIRRKIFDLAKTRKTSTKDKNLELLLTYEQASEETSNIACLLLIPSLLAVTSIRLKNTAKKIWRPSKAEATAGFIHHVKNDSDIRTGLICKQTKFQEYGLTVQPFIIIVGETLENIKSYFIVINEVFYAVSNILTAVSLCFKITWVINAQYPVECHSTWMFIQKAFFQFKTKYDSSSTSALTLLGELGIDV